MDHSLPPSRSVIVDKHCAESESPGWSVNHILAVDGCPGWTCGFAVRSLQACAKLYGARSWIKQTLSIRE